MKKILIAAIARNGVIGRTNMRCPDCGGSCLTCNWTGRVPANDIPWSYHEIDAHFDAVTEGQAVIYGRRTWESRGGWPLKGRIHHVVTSSLFSDDLARAGAIKGEFIEDAITDVQNRGRGCSAYFAGGAQLYAAALPLADELDLTLIDRNYEGDVKFPVGAILLRGRVFEYGEPGTGAFFECVERRKGEHPTLTFTKWVRR